MKKRILAILLAVFIICALLGISAFAATKTGTVTGDEVRMRSGPGTSYSTITYLNKGTQVIILDDSGTWYKISYNGTEGYMINTYISVNSTSEDDGGSEEEEEIPTTKTGTVTGDVVNMRSGAGTNYSVVAQLSQGSKVTVLDDSGSWYKISYNGKEGYMLGTYISVNTGENDDDEGTGTGGGSVYDPLISLSYMNSTYKPYIISAVELNIDEKFEPIYENALSRLNPYVGYIEDYSGYTYSECYTTLNIKTGDTVTLPFGSSIIPVSGSVKLQSATGDVIDISEGKVAAVGTELSGMTRYFAADDCTAVFTASSDSSVMVDSYYIYKDADGGEDTPTEKTGTVTGNEVRMRSGPGVSYSTITYLNKGTKVTILDDSGTWYKISYNGKEGYMISTYISVDSTTEGEGGGSSGEDTPTEKTGTVTGNEVRMRSGPGVSYSTITYLNKGTKVTVLDDGGTWYKISYNGKEGYMMGSYISIDSSTGGNTGGSDGEDDTPTTQTGTITGNYVNMRSGAGTGYSIVTQLNKGTKVTILETSGSWYKVSYGSYTGYVSGSYVSPDSAVVTKTGTVTGNYVNMRSGAGTGYSIVTQLNKGAKVTVLATSGSWYKVSYGSYTGYISSNYISV